MGLSGSGNIYDWGGGGGDGRDGEEKVTFGFKSRGGDLTKKKQEEQKGYRKGNIWNSVKKDLVKNTSIPSPSKTS